MGIPTPTTHASENPPDSAEAITTLKRVDDYPLYTMTIKAPSSTSLQNGERSLPPGVNQSHDWGCSLFAALGDKQNLLFGRNFDWDYSPALLLFYQPADGYASVSMIDLSFLLDSSTLASDLTTLPPQKLMPLMDTPSLPFDGMNEKGLAIGMAAVPDGEMIPDPARETIDSIQVIREILDHAASVDQAVAIFNRYNIDMGGGPPIHYLISDASGSAVLVEFSKGKMEVLPNTQSWHSATNFLVSASGASTAGECWRYDTIEQKMKSTSGVLDAESSRTLLLSVHTDRTRWSIVYNNTTLEANVFMGGNNKQVHSFKLEP